jgi:hypothetical protein
MGHHHHRIQDRSAHSAGKCACGSETAAQYQKASKREAISRELAASGSGVYVGVLVGGAGVLVEVGGTGVLVGVFVGGAGVLVGVLVGGTGVSDGIGVGVSVAGAGDPAVGVSVGVPEVEVGVTVIEPSMTSIDLVMYVRLSGPQAVSVYLLVPPSVGQSE